MDARAVAELPWVRALRPIRGPYEERLSTHSPLVVWHVDVEFDEWRIPAEVAERWRDSRLDAEESWRKRPLAVGVDSGCAYSCGEVELAARLRRGGFEAYWISEWSGFPHVTHWEAFCVKRSEMKSRLNALWSFDQRLRAASSGTCIDLETRGGHPDVAAWMPGGDDYLFLEYKGPGDSIKPKQNAWAQALADISAPRVAYLAVKGVFRGAGDGTSRG